MLYVSVRWSRLVEENFRRSSGRMGRIVAIVAALGGALGSCCGLEVWTVWWGSCAFTLSWAIGQSESLEVRKHLPWCYSRLGKRLRETHKARYGIRLVIVQVDRSKS